VNVEPASVDGLGEHRLGPRLNKRANLIARRERVVYFWNPSRVKWYALDWVFLCLTTGLAGASQWTDPDWDEMLKQSGAITLVEVTEGGRFMAKVRSLTVFKGQPPTEFYVVGFNNHNWPDDAVQKESFQTGERYYLFPRPEATDLSVLTSRAFTTGDASFISTVEKATSSTVMEVWTPSAGDLRLEGEQVRYGLLQTSYPHYGPKHGRLMFERFLRGALAF